MRHNRKKTEKPIALGLGMRIEIPGTFGRRYPLDARKS